MPVDAWGNRAEVIMDGDSTIKRMNVGRVYEQYINATSREVTYQLQAICGVIPAADVQMHRIMDERVRALVGTGNRTEALNHLLRYYDVVSPIMSNIVDEALLTAKSPEQFGDELLDKVLKDGIELYVPPNSPNMGHEVIRDLRHHFPIPLSPVTYRGGSGKLVTTKVPVLIGSVYIIELEKTGSDWAAVASARRQHFGVLAKLTNADKHSLPWREQPVRLLGEAEVRLFAATIGPQATADLLELPNSPAAQKMIARNILMADKPTAIDKIVDHNIVPRGLSRAGQFIDHILQCSGIRFTNK